MSFFFTIKVSLHSQNFSNKKSFNEFFGRGWKNSRTQFKTSIFLKNKNQSSVWKRAEMSNIEDTVKVRKFNFYHTDIACTTPLLHRYNLVELILTDKI